MPYVEVSWKRVICIGVGFNTPQIAIDGCRHSGFRTFDLLETPCAREENVESYRGNSGGTLFGCFPRPIDRTLQTSDAYIVIIVKEASGLSASELV